MSTNTTTSSSSSTELCVSCYLQEVLNDQDSWIAHEQGTLSLEDSCRLCADCNHLRRESPPGSVPYWDGQTDRMQALASITSGAESKVWARAARLDDEASAMAWKWQGEWPQILSPVPRRPYMCVPLLRAYGHDRGEYYTDNTSIGDDESLANEQQQSTPYDSDGDVLMEGYPGYGPLEPAAAQLSVEVNDILSAQRSVTEDPSFGGYDNHIDAAPLDEDGDVVMGEDWADGETWSDDEIY
ncbi:hypothetical protein VMCG_00353 [Cytospora schulzeri]|uniref:Uncharacterized protein n=1 Tax=Cytospora schulzeri TaxID=448051 RepID=A0A423X9R7_9PEZI|nr:hypothetical protein VMCG_00353 [Valsa malicola]